MSAVLANGDIVTINKNSYPDLFWAARGGGSGFVILINITMETFDIPNDINGVNITIAAKDMSSASTDSYLNALAYFISISQDLADNGITGYPMASAGSYNGFLMGWGKTKDQVNDFFNPVITKLQSMGVNVVMNPLTGDIAFNTSAPVVPALDFSITSRLLSGEALRDAAKVKAMLNATFATGAMIQPFLVLGGKTTTNSESLVSANPSLRLAAIHFCILNIGKTDSWSEALTTFKLIHDVQTPLLEPFAVNNAAYVNEVYSPFSLLFSASRVAYA
jgi:hypothetical protein